MDYYSILGVTKQSSQDDIKKAYRKLAMEHHPDRGGDSIKFAEINEAYETLKDPVKRSQYDTPAPSFDFRFTNFEDVFSSFGAFSKNKDIKLAVTITLEDVLTGKDLILNYGLFNGQSTTATIRIHAGVENGEGIRFKGLGDNRISQLPRGDLIVIVKISKHPTFDRDGKHLYLTQKVNVFDLMLGTKIEVKTLTGNNLSVNIVKGTQPGTTLSISGHGLIDNKSNTTGNLYVTIKGFVPKINDVKILEKVKELNDAISKIT